MGDALKENINTAAGLSMLLNNLFGTTSTTSKGGGTTTSTKQTQYSDAAVQALIKGLMEDPSTGLAKVASGSRIPGMYNTTSQQLMINDLITRAAGQAEIARAPVVTTETKTGSTDVTKTKGQMNSMLPLLGATMLFSKGKDGKTGWDSISSALGGAFGGSSDSSFGADILAQADAEYASLFPSGYNSQATGYDFGNDSIGALISSLTSDSGSASGGIDLSIGEALGGIGDLVDQGTTYVKDLYDEAADWIGSWF